MAWIESHDTLKDHPKTRRLRRLLGINLAQAIGHLHLLWWWAATYAQDGDLSHYDAIDIAEAADWDGDPEQFLSALIEAGFVDQDDDGTRLHDWYDYAGKLIELRARDAARKRAARKRTADGCPADVQRTSSGRDADVRRNHNHNHNHNHTWDDDKSSSPDGPVEDDRPTAKGQIAELVEHYRQSCNAEPKQRDYAFMGRLYNTYPIDRIYEAIDATALQIAAGQQLEDPLKYLAGVLRNAVSGRTLPRGDPDIDAERARIIAELKAQEEAAATGTEGRARSP